MHVRCRLIGHVVGEYQESGFNVCPTCGAHEYYDYESYKNSANLLWPWYELRRQWARLVDFFNRHVCRRCVSCNRAELLFGRRVGRHTDCIPF